MHCLPERVIRHQLGTAEVVNIQLANTAAEDFKGKLVYLQQAPSSGYVGKQYCVVNSRESAAHSGAISGRPPFRIVESIVRLRWCGQQYLSPRFARRGILLAVSER